MKSDERIERLRDERRKLNAALSACEDAREEAEDRACERGTVLRAIREHLAAGETLAGDQWLPSCQATTILREIERVL